MMHDPFDMTDEPDAPNTPIHAGVEPPWLSGLNPEQRQAVTITEGPLLVLSGAGTGKTRVLTARLAHILSLRLAQPWRLLAVTFTNRAAREMQERVGQMIGGQAEQLWLGTFHALAAKMLRRHADIVGLTSSFTILDSDDQLRVLKPILAERSVDTKKWTPQGLMGILQRWKDRGWRVDTVPGDEATALAGVPLRAIYSDYQARLIALNACDFGDLLLHVLTVFQSHPDILAEYQERFRYILVDEYQDTNVSQYLWLRLLSAKHRNICCVGDDDQSIYSWRGAEVGNILRFEQDFPGANIVRLERNYRSTPAILGAASGVIRHNSDRLGKDLRAVDATDPGDKVTVYSTWDGESEARWVVERVEALERAGTSLGSMAVLVRAGFQTREFEERLIARATPYRVVGGLRFYERQEIRDAVAYLRLIEQPTDDLAFERIINTPKRGLGEAALQTVTMASRASGIPLLAAARSILETDELKTKARKALAEFVKLVDDWAALKEGMEPSELAAMVLDQSGYLEFWKLDKAPEAPGRVENLNELIAALEGFGTLTEFLEHIALVMENDSKAQQGAAITLMTLHAAKGLEFDVVFLPGWEETIFPHRRALDEGGKKGLEEERRLAYVGLTRARQRVFVSHAASRRVYGQWQSAIPSRFIAEIPEAYKETDGEQGLTASGGGQTESWSTWNGGYAQKPKAPAQGWAAPVGKKPAAFDLGERVFHAKFGHGHVTEVDGDKLTVDFDYSGAKKVMAGFVTKGE